MSLNFGAYNSCRISSTFSKISFEKATIIVQKCELQRSFNIFKFHRVFLCNCVCFVFFFFQRGIVLCILIGCRPCHSLSSVPRLMRSVHKSSFVIILQYWTCSKRENVCVGKVCVVSCFLAFITFVIVLCGLFFEWNFCDKRWYTV